MRAIVLGACCLLAVQLATPVAAQGPFDASVKVEAPPVPPRSPPRVPKVAKEATKEAAKEAKQPLSGEEQARAARYNAWTIGLAGELPEGSFAHYAADLAKALDDGENLRVLPIMSYGAVGNVLDLLYLNGVDVVITYADVLDHFKTAEKIANLERRLNYIIPMFQGDFHLLVRPEIKTVQDLAGKKVGFDTPGSGANYTGAIVFDRLGIKVEKVLLNNAQALEAMAGRELAGLVHVAAKPNALLARLVPELGFHFLAVAYSDKFRDYYVPAELTSADYPSLVAQGRTVETISVQAVLAVHNAPPDSDRARRSVRFVEYLFDRFDRLRAPPFQAGWKEMNLAGTIRGWTRFPPAQAMLDKARARSSVDMALARAQAARAAPGDLVEQERLFKEFMQWSRQPKRL